jgi:guanylate kinase
MLASLPAAIPMHDAGPGKLLVVSGPSGAGKTTVLKEVYRRARQPLVASVSATTRPPRAGEQDGVAYHFLTPEEFQRRREAGEFIECFEVFGHKYWYGTLWSEVTPRLAAGKWVVLEIDVQGAAAVLEKFPAANTFFVRLDSLEELERRLRGRGSETPESLARRLETARRELELADRYQFQIINDDLDRAAAEFCRHLDQLEGVRT